MQTIKTIISAAAAFAAVTYASPAGAVGIPNDYAVTFDASSLNTPVVINLNGLSDGNVVAGLTSVLTLTLESFSGTSAVLAFDFLNSSSSPVTASRITGFGFDVDPNAKTASIDSDYFAFASSGNYPDNGLIDHAVEVCFTNNTGQNHSCAGSQDGISKGSTGDGTFTLTFDPGVSQFTLSGLIARYQGIAGAGNVTSATGIPVPGIPEPATWALMILGFALAGSAIRRRRLAMPRVFA